MNRHPILLCLLALGLAGCGQSPEPPTQPAPSAPPPKAVPAKAEPSAVQTVVNGLTGKTAVDQGLRARDQIKAISAREQRDRDDAMQP